MHRGDKNGHSRFNYSRMASTPRARFPSNIPSAWCRTVKESDTTQSSTPSQGSLPHIPMPFPDHSNARRRTLAATNVCSGALEVRFVWAVDRWSHCVVLDGQPVWQSLEGPWPCDRDPDWPASPAFVEIDRVGSGPLAAVVAVGLAGRTHYSVSISADAHRPAALLFDVACRIHQTPQWIGTSYAPMAASVTAESLLARAVIEPVSQCVLEIGDPIVQLRATGNDAFASAGSPFPGPTTVVWSYRIARASLPSCDRPANRSDS